MKKILTLFFIFSSIVSKADQLAWVSLEQAKIATEYLISQEEIISWCACCNDDKMFLINIQSSYYKKVEGQENFYEVFIYGKDIYGNEINKSFDLAYLHCKKNNLAVCLGVALGFECKPCTPNFKWPFDKIDNNKVEITESTIDDDGFQYVTTSKEGSNYSILIEKSEFNTTEIWVKNSVPLKTKKNSKGKLIKIGGGYVMTYMAINCEDKEFNIEEKVSYNSKGEVINSDKFGSYGNKIVPGSVMSAIYKFVCNN